MIKNICIYHKDLILAEENDNSIQLPPELQKEFDREYPSLITLQKIVIFVKEEVEKTFEEFGETMFILVGHPYSPAMLYLYINLNEDGNICTYNGNKIIPFDIYSLEEMHNNSLYRGGNH